MITVKNNKKGFSLSENLTVLFVLGIIIALTVPKLVVSRRNTTNRLHVRKSIVTYQDIVEKTMIQSTGVRTLAGINNVLRNNNCNLVNSKFKTVRNDGCDFVTEDGVHWNLSNGASDAIISVSSAEPNFANALDSSNSAVFYIPFSINNGSVNFLVDGNLNGVGRRAKDRETAINKTRTFIIGE